MTSTTPPTEGLKPPSDPAILQEKIAQPQVVSRSAPINTTLTKVGTFVKRTTDYPPWVPATVVSTTTEKSTASFETVVRTVALTPNFHQLVKVGAILPVNPFTHRKTVETTNYRMGITTTHFDGKLVKEIVTEGPLWTGKPAAYSAQDLTSSQMNALDRRAIIKIRNQLKDQKVNIAMIIAERNKTALSMAKIVKTIAEMVIQLKKGNLAGAAGAMGAHVGYRKRRSYERSHKSDPTKAFANAWLELQYAIKPLLMDVKGLAEALADFRYQKATGTATATVKQLISETVSVPGSSAKRTSVGNVSIRYVVYFSIDYPEMPKITSLGLTNPAQLAWEIVPFSFVVDWFLPIGEWLGSLDATIGMNFSDGSKSVKKNLSSVFQEHNVTESVSRSAKGEITRTVTRTNDKSSFTEESLVRTKLTAFPGGVTYPSFKNPASMMHLTTALALLRGIASK